MTGDRTAFCERRNLGCARAHEVLSRRSGCESADGGVPGNSVQFVPPNLRRSAGNALGAQVSLHAPVPRCLNLTRSTDEGLRSSIRAGPSI
jgi:hypothetical protein